MTFLYNTAFLVLAILSLPSFFARLRQSENGRELFSQRMGILPRELREKLIGKRIIWLHAVSVGEVMVVEGFVQKLLQECPGYHVVITTVTPTGQKIAKKMESAQVSVCYFPFDFSFAVRSFLREFQPECLLLTETEIWPNLINEADLAHVPIGLLNARLSPKSARRYCRFHKIFRPLFGKLAFVLAQTENDAKRFREAGAPEGEVHVLGNMKYDNILMDADAGEIKKKYRELWNFSGKEKVLIAGSTHRGEEEMFVRAFPQLKSKYPELKMVIAPRHIERAGEVLNLFSGISAKVVTASNNDKSREPFDVLILDQLGVLKEIYALADVVFVGGSMVPKRGGQNPIEPAVFRKAIVHGAHVFNFEQVYQALDNEGGAMLAKDESELVFALERVIGSPAEQERLGKNAYDVITSLQGATRKHIRWLADFLASETELVKG